MLAGAVRRFLTLLGGGLAVAALISAAAPALGAGSPARTADVACPNADLVPASDNLARVEAAVLCLIDRERVGAGLVPLGRSVKLDRSALFHSAEMVRYHFLGHEASGRPSLLARIRGYGYFSGATGGLYAENVGAGPSSNGTAHALMDAWMASPGHRENLLYPRFRDVGIAAVLAPPDRAFFADFPSTVYTTDFGARYVRRRCVIRRPASRPGPGSASPRRQYCRRR
jgi:uncharacterized protein YkwD